MSPSTFFQDQIARVHRALISAAPVQRFTAAPQQPDVRVLAPRRERIATKRPRRSGTPLAEHGTLSRYSAGCRCLSCKACNAAYGRRWRAARVAAGYQT